jgi:DNA-binding response OmpR family regulator
LCHFQVSGLLLPNLSAHPNLRIIRRGVHQTPGKDPVPIKTVLLVEDDVDIRDALTILLHEAPTYQVIGVPDGFAVLKVVRTLVPHLVLLDYLLPGMDGLECLDMLRASKGMEQTPVILMSAGRTFGIKMRGRVQARSDLIFLEKPFEMDTLLDLIRRHLER